MMTNAEFAILSLIVEEQRHGYEIERVIEERGMRNWTEVGFSSIYYLLKKLEKAGLVSSSLQSVEGRGPARKIYTATSDGIEACGQATRFALATPQRFYPPVQLGLSNLANISIIEAIEALKEHREGLYERIQEVEANQKNATQPMQAELMFDFAFAIINAQIEWLNTTIQKLETKNESS